MNKGTHYKEEDLRDIEFDLKDLSIQFISLLQQYKDQGVIDDEQYQQHVKTKLNFLQYLKNKKEI